MLQLGLFGGEEPAGRWDEVDGAVRAAVADLEILVSSTGQPRSRIGAAAGDRGLVSKVLRSRNPHVRTLARLAAACGRRLVVSFEDASGGTDSLDRVAALVLAEARELITSELLPRIPSDRRGRRSTERVARVVGRIDALLERE